MRSNNFRPAVSLVWSVGSQISLAMTRHIRNGFHGVPDQSYAPQKHLTVDNEKMPCQEGRAIFQPSFLYPLSQMLYVSVSVGKVDPLLKAHGSFSWLGPSHSRWCFQFDHLWYQGFILISCKKIVIYILPKEGAPHYISMETNLVP